MSAPPCRRLRAGARALVFATVRERGVHRAIRRFLHETQLDPTIFGGEAGRHIDLAGTRTGNADRDTTPRPTSSTSPVCQGALHADTIRAPATVNAADGVLELRGVKKPVAWISPTPGTPVLSGRRDGQAAGLRRGRRRSDASLIPNEVAISTGGVRAGPDTGLSRGKRWKQASALGSFLLSQKGAKAKGVPQSSRIWRTCFPPFSAGKRNPCAAPSGHGIHRPHPKLKKLHPREAGPAL